MNYQFTKFGIIVAAVVLWTSSQSGSPEVKRAINSLLLVLLASMILLNWSKISPLFLTARSGGFSTQTGKTNSTGQTQMR